MRPSNWSTNISLSDDERPNFQSSISTITDPGGIRDKPQKIILNKENDEYGFYLQEYQNSTKHLINEVDNGSVAYQSGLRKGVFLACINGEDVMHLSHDECLKRIKESGDRVELTVASEQLIDFFYKHNITAVSEEEYGWLYPQDCVFAYKNETFVDETDLDPDSNVPSTSGLSGNLRLCLSTPAAVVTTDKTKYYNDKSAVATSRAPSDGPGTLTSLVLPLNGPEMSSSIPNERTEEKKANSN